MSGKINGLTEAQRRDAFDSLRAEIAGKKPQEADSSASATYPPLVVGILLVMLALVFVGAAYPSLIRLYNAGYNSFLEVFPNMVGEARVAGVATFLMATFLIVVSTIAVRLLITGRKEKWLWFIPISVGVLMETVGNYIMVKPYEQVEFAKTLWAYLETFGPPVVFGFMALVAEKLLLDRVEQKAKAAGDYQKKLVAWQNAYDLAHETPSWKRKLPNKLKSALTDANIEKRPAAVRGMTAAEWKVAVVAELEDEDWFDRSYEIAPPKPKSEPIRIEKPAEKPKTGRAKALLAPPPASADDSVERMRLNMREKMKGLNKGGKS